MLHVDLDLRPRLDDSLLGATRSTDSAVLARAMAGDREAFATLVDEQLEPTFRRALAILGNEADARDATQDIFVRAWRSLGQLRDSNHFEAWFGRIVVNTCRSAARGRQRRGVHEIQVAALPDSGENLPTRGVAHDVQSVAIDATERALDRIAPGERVLLALHYHEHLPLEQIGVLLGLPARTVKSRLFSARRSLARALEVEGR
jgi:RNA polymerase sigma-70 factor (ECF subfamily)